EIEKAHFKVHNLLLQIMDEGFLTDNKGSIVGFSNTIVFLTSNIGVDEVEQVRNRMGFDIKKREVPDKTSLKDAFTDAMKDAFNPEFINRLDEVIVFNPLNTKDCVKIARNQLNEVASYLESSEITLSFTKKVEKHIARTGYNPEYGARELRRIIQKEIENPLSQIILEGGFKAGDTIIADVVRNKMNFKAKASRIRAKGKKTETLPAVTTPVNDHKPKPETVPVES
ncbi:MAG: AAA family ATPase, partial [Planctomycetes bacterium]|nr:AAA family ATPase [Planctomycetota bacterium]